MVLCVRCERLAIGDEASRLIKDDSGAIALLPASYTYQAQRTETRKVQLEKRPQRQSDAQRIPNRPSYSTVPRLRLSTIQNPWRWT